MKRKSCVIPALALCLVSMIYTPGGSSEEAVGSKQEAAKEEASKRAVIERVGNDVYFYDENGRVAKQVSFKLTKETYKTVDGQEATGRICGTEVFVSKNGKYAFVYEHDSAWEREAFEFYGFDGKMLFSRKDIEHFAHFANISDDGRIFTVITDKTGGVPEREIYPRTFVIFNKNGEIIWELETVGTTGNFYLTPNGKYGYYQCTRKTRKGGYQSVVVFFDVEKKRKHEAKVMGGIKITNEGMATMSLDVTRRTERRIEVVGEKVVYRYQFK